MGQAAEELRVHMSPRAPPAPWEGSVIVPVFPFIWSRGKKSHHGCAQAPPGDAAICLQLAEREQALLLAQETIQVSPVPVTLAKRCPRGSTEAGTGSLCLPNRPVPVVYTAAQMGVCSASSASWAAPASVPGSGGTLGRGPARRWGFAVGQLARVWLGCSSGCSRAALGS